MEEDHIIKYINKFSGGLNQNKEFNVILFLEGHLIYCKNNTHKKKKRKNSTSTFNKKVKFFILLQK